MSGPRRKANIFSRKQPVTKNRSTARRHTGSSKLPQFTPHKKTASVVIPSEKHLVTAWKQGTPPALLMDIYNHSSYRITQHYLGISQDERDEIYLKLDL